MARAEPVAAAATHIDISDLADHLGYALKRAQLRVFGHFLEAVAPLKLTPAQFSVLLLLESNPGRNQTEVATTLGILRPNFVALLDALETRGLCSRTRSVDDRRSHVLALTDKGRATLAEAKRLVAARHEKKLATILTATERSDLLEMLERITRLLDLAGPASEGRLPRGGSGRQKTAGLLRRADGAAHNGVAKRS